MESESKKLVFAIIILVLSLAVSSLSVFAQNAKLSATNKKIKTEFGSPVQNQSQNPDKISKENTYTIEVYSAAGLGVLKNGDAVDNGDFYRADGRKIRLFRSLWKIAVRTKGKNQSPDIEGINKLLDKKPRLKEGQTIAFGKILKTETRMSPEEFKTTLAELRQSDKFERVDPVFINEETGKEMLVTSRIVVKSAPGVLPEQLKNLHRIYNAQVVGFMHGSSDEIILDLGETKAEETLNICERYLQDPRVLWASPDFLFQLDLFLTPNDILYGDQWHLHNTGQGGATVDADVDAPEAWDTSTGDAAIVIAIIDTGVETTHPDLNDNIYVNAVENGGVGGVDDDGNGYIDDINGWDFYDDDNDPNPGVGVTPGHGTCCAGVAAGEGNNALGVAGIAYGCKILPIKIGADDGTFPTSSTVIGDAIRYAAEMADVLSNSWGGGGDDVIIHSAIQYAVDTKGKPVFFSSGNYASSFYQYWVTGILPGNHTFRWEYSKDGTGSAGEDSVWVDGVIFPGGEIESFEGASLPAGWTTGGGSNWEISTTHALTGWSGEAASQSVKAGAITHGQMTYLQTTKLIVVAGDLSFYAWVSSESGCDFFDFYVDASHEVTNVSGVYYIDYNVAYPARYSECIAVGASTDYNYRSDYSEYDYSLSHVLNIVAPSNGGNWGITTTDITGADGYDSGDYTDPEGESGFGGTSSACPLAAGIGALLLSQNPALTPNEIKATLCISADKIGDISYVDGYNKYYGYGRVNAKGALDALGDPIAHVIYASAGSGGSISPAGDIVVGNGNNQAFSITSAEGYLINDVVVDGVSQGAIGSYTFESVTTGHTITADFVAIGGDDGEDGEDGEENGFGGDQFSGDQFGGGGGTGKTGCFIATVCFRTPLADEVQILSRFRDEYLLSNSVGKVFVGTYYNVSPVLADFINRHPVLKNAAREMLKPVVWLVKRT